jgi:LEA14-like dessication related protein
MPTRRPLLRALAISPLIPVFASGCAVSPFGEPPRVQLAGIDSLPGEGMELRFMVRLRVQNPNHGAIDYDGVSLELDLRGQAFASGVAPLEGSVPGFGEVLLSVPVTVSGLAIARQVFGLVRDGKAGPVGKVAYALRGRLGGGLGGARFAASGDIDLGV